MKKLMSLVLAAVMAASVLILPASADEALRRKQLEALQAARQRKKGNRS